MNITEFAQQQSQAFSVVGYIMWPVVIALGLYMIYLYSNEFLNNEKETTKTSNKNKSKRT
jgi:hypothetical protein